MTIILQIKKTNKITGRSEVLELTPDQHEQLLDEIAKRNLPYGVEVLRSRDL